MKKKSVSLFLALVMCFSLFACSNPAQNSSESKPGTTSTDGETQTLKVAMLMPNATTSPYVVKLAEYATELAEQKGWDFHLFDANDDYTKQTSQFESAIVMQPDVILFFPHDAAAGVQDVKKAYEAGIPVICFNADVAEEGHQYCEAFVGPNNYGLAQEIAEAVDANLGGSGKIAIIDGAPAAAHFLIRYEGFVETLEAKGGYEIVAHEYCNNDRTQAQTVMENYLTAYPDLDAVYITSGNYAMGAILAIEAAGKTDDIQVYSIDAMAEAIQAIGEGKIKLTGVHQPTKLIEKMFEVVERVVIDNEEINEYNQYYDYYVLDESNYMDYTPDY